MLFSPALVDDGRKKKALDGAMTPFEIDEEAKVATFPGSEGELYSASLSGCTCTDFHMNLAGERPCKHMIRLAMELGEYPADGMETDIDAANAKYYFGVLKRQVEEGVLLDAINIVRITETARTSKLAFETDALAFAGVPDMLESGLFTATGKNPKIVTIKRWRKQFDALQRSLTNRLGELVLSNLDNEQLIDILGQLPEERFVFTM